MSTTFGIIIDDLKSSLKLAKNNMLSYFLANLGMLVLVGFLLAIIVLPFAAIAIAAGPVFWADVGVNFSAMAVNSPLALGGAAMLIAVPFLSLFIVVVGSIYGMSKDLVESGETKAELAFSWFKRKFLTFAGAGAILSLFIIFPPAILSASVAYAMGGAVAGLASTLLAVFSFVWVFITVGLTSLVLPAVVNGAGVQDAFKESFKLSIERFDRVFGLWTAIVLLFFVSFAPVMVAGIAAMGFPPLAIHNPLFALVGGWAVFVAFLWILLLLPMAIISFVKVYHELTGRSVASPVQPEVPIM